MHRYRIVHVYTDYSNADYMTLPVTTETYIGDGPMGLLDALSTVIRVSGPLNEIKRALDDGLVTVFTNNGRFNLVRVGE